MTSPQLDIQPDTLALDPAPPEIAAAEDSGPASIETTESAAAAEPRATLVVRAAVAVKRPALGAVTVARTGTSAVRRSTTGLAARLPGTLNAARAGAHWTVEALQTLPDGTLRSLAATSVGLGAGLSFTRAGRLAAVAGVMPAVVIGTVIVVRPSSPVAAEGAGG